MKALNLLLFCRSWNIRVNEATYFVMFITFICCWLKYFIRNKLWIGISEEFVRQKVFQCLISGLAELKQCLLIVE